MEKVTIYHNPNCGTSRNVLGLLQTLDLDLEIIYYLETPPSRETLIELVGQMGISWSDLVRTNVPEYEKHGLDKEGVTDRAILDAMMEDPILINRPIVVSSKRTILARPSEKVLEVLPVPMTEDYVKEDGEVIKAP